MSDSTYELSREIRLLTEDIADKRLILGCVAVDDYYYQCGRHCILMKERERISRCTHLRWKFEGDKTWHKL